MDQDEECIYYQKVLASFNSYSSMCHSVLSKYISDYESLPEHKRQLLLNYRSKLNIAHSLVQKNQEFLCQVAGPSEQLNFSPKHFDNLKSTLRQLVRDWTAEGLHERAKCYSPILKYISAHCPKGSKILVPGAGLGRLTYEIAKLGMQAQGNEFSYFMLLISEHILNLTQVVNEFKIHPYCLDFSNAAHQKDQFLAVSIPDELPSLPVSS